MTTKIQNIERTGRASAVSYKSAPVRATKIIAEACANHLGDKKIQEEMIWAAAEAGADYIKFQSWQVATNTRGQADAMRPYELSDDDHHRLLEVARKAGIGFATTAFDCSRLEFLATLPMDFLKLASPDCGSSALLLQSSKLFPKIILSTGMSDWAEIQKASELVSQTGAKLALLHCMYPLVDGKYHVRRMLALRSYASEIGLSDHSEGADLRASKLAIALGADWLERHFILDRKIDAKDVKVSVDPAGLREIVQAKYSPIDVLAWQQEQAELFGAVDAVPSASVAKLRDFYVGRWGDNR